MPVTPKLNTVCEQLNVTGTSWKLTVPVDAPFYICIVGEQQVCEFHTFVYRLTLTHDGLTSTGVTKRTPEQTGGTVSEMETSFLTNAFTLVGNTPNETLPKCVTFDFRKTELSIGYWSTREPLYVKRISNVPISWPVTSNHLLVSPHPNVSGSTPLRLTFPTETASSRYGVTMRVPPGQTGGTVTFTYTREGTNMNTSAGRAS